MLKGRPFQPGQSGNPGGRPKAEEDVRALARSYTKDAINALRTVVLKGKNESARVSAATTLLDRGWGKPLQQVEVKRTPFDELSPAELTAIARALEAIGIGEAGSAGGHPGPTVEGEAVRLPTVQ